jgi:hypothetical protein
VTIDATCALSPEASREDPGPAVAAAISPCIEAIVGDLRSHLAAQAPADG